MNKKGQIGNLISVVGVLVVVGILIASGFVILQEFFQQDALTDTSITAEDTTAWINETGYTLDGASVDGFNNVAITTVINGTGDLTILAGNYTVSDAGVVTNATDTTWEYVNITYTYDRGESAYLAMNSSIDAMTTFPDLLGILILIAVVGIILAVVFNVIPTGRTSGA